MTKCPRSSVEDQIVQAAGLEVAVKGLQGRLFGPGQIKRKIPLREVSIEPDVIDNNDSFEEYVDDTIND